MSHRSSRSSRLGRLWLVPFGVLFAGCASDESVAPGPPLDPADFTSAPKSCAYLCPNTTCAEYDTPYACPAMGDWNAIGHAPVCPAWDGTYPAPVAGQCTASAPSGKAVLFTGPDPSEPGESVLPDGRAHAPAGAEWTFDEVDVVGGMTIALAAVPGTPYVLTVDVGNKDHAVRAVDTSLIGTGNPVTAVVEFSGANKLVGGIAFVAPGRVYVSTAFGVVQALSFDAATGALATDDAASLTMPPDGEGGAYIAATLAATPDGHYLVMSPVLEERALVFDIDPASPSYRQQVGAVSLGANDTFGIYFDPHDANGDYAYVSMWGDAQVAEIDLTDRAAPVVNRTFATDNDPEGVAFLDARFMAVANDYGETLSLVDRMTGDVTTVPVAFDAAFKGIDVSVLAWDEANARLYALLAGVDALAAWDVDLGVTPPALAPLGYLATSWWPSGMVVHPDGSLTVSNLRGKPIGPYEVPSPIGEGEGDAEMRGSVQHIPAPSLAALQAGVGALTSAVAVGERAGYPTVDCPPGVADFPVPATNEEGPSPVIEHVVFVVRENKTYDALLGDLQGAEGDPSLTMKTSSADMDAIWTNFRELARTFTASDNFYNLAVQSTQGHQWTTYGRATDFCERTWSADHRPVPFCGIIPIGRPDGGSLFEWLQDNDVVYSLLGEIVGTPQEFPPGYNPIDVRYPGGPFQNITYNDLEKSCYFSGRARVSCDIGSFVYMTLPNDHTVGVSTDNPTAETMCAVNDEATGMVLEALSHSPFWANTLVVITEDDPQQGGDHVDYHRTPLVLASPWVKRGYVSRTHIDVASLHKLFAHILGLPYANLTVKNAGLPLDMFTSTPDYTPYEYTRRSWPLGCGGAVASKAEAEITDSWDFRYPDAQPGLGDQVMRWMRGRQLTELTPELRAEVEARKSQKARGLAPARGDDD